MTGAAIATRPDATFLAQRARSQADFRAKIPEHVERLCWSAERIAAHQTRELRRVLHHARACSPFYARRLAGVDLDSFTPADLPRLPTLGKAEMMASFDEVMTDRRVTLRKVEAQLARTADLPLLLDDEYLCLASGGSSGLRGIFVWHWRDSSDFALALLRPALAHAQALGGVPPGGIVAALVGAAPRCTRRAAGRCSSPAICSICTPCLRPCRWTRWWRGRTRCGR